MTFAVLPKGRNEEILVVENVKFLEMPTYS